MRDEARLAQTIAAILTGSGLSLERRAEVAEELRGHLEQQIASKREKGASEAEAVEAALAEFGSPKMIRKQLRRQQRMQDHRRALAQLRQGSLWHLVGCTVFAGFVVIPAPAPATRLMWWLNGVFTIAWFFLLISWVGYALSRFGFQLQRPCLRGEHCFWKSLLQWSGLVFVALLGFGVLSFGPSTIPAHLFYARPEFHPLYLIWRELGINLLLILAVIEAPLCAMCVVLYERSRCVDEPMVLAND